MSDAETVAPRGSRLTVRELQALEARDRADSDAEAAASLGISVWTLRTHLRNARARLGVKRTHRAIQTARTFDRRPN